MEGQVCSRCSNREYIHTHQGIKFEMEVNYLCEHCWSYFLEWLNKKGNGGHKPGQVGEGGQCGRCHRKEWIPNYQFIKNLQTCKEIFMCQDCWEYFREWFHKKRHEYSIRRAVE